MKSTQRAAVCAWLLLMAGGLHAQASDKKADALRVFMPDGQLTSHSVRVYVNRDISLTDHPSLRLLRSHAVTQAAVDEARRYQPGVIASGQQWTEQIDGQSVLRSGTLLMFDLSGLDLQYKAMIRVMPVLTWAESDPKNIAVSEHEVNLGSIAAAFLWTLLVVAAGLGAILLLCWRAKTPPSLLLTGVDGHLSLAKTQVSCWTVVVGGTVLGYGMIRLAVPDIPASLVTLMGASLATGGVAYFRDEQKQAAVQPAPQPPAVKPKLADLICIFTPGQAAPELSLSKAQMLFWTVLLLVLFVSKSILDGAIWDVPWALVALMGFSQAGYLAPKLVP